MNTSSVVNIFQSRVFSYLFLMGLVAVATSLQSLVFARILSPESLGYYSIVMTVASYGIVMQLGLLNGLFISLPVVFGRGHERRARRLVGEATIVVTIVAFVCLAIYLIIIAWLPISDPNIKKAFLVGGILATSQSYFQIVTLRLRAEQRVIAFPVFMLCHRILTILGGAVAAYYYSFIGLSIAIVIANVVLYTYTTIKHLGPADYTRVNRKEITGLARKGLPLMGAGLLDNLRLSLDKIFLIGLVTPASLGIYQFASFALHVGFLLNSVVDQFLAPRLLYEYGRDRGIREVFKKSLMVSVGFTGIALVLLPVVIAVTDDVVYRWFPSYEQSIVLVPIFYLGGAFSLLASVSVTINAANKQFLSTIASAITVGISFILFLWLANHGADMKTYAYVISAAILLQSTLFIGIAYYASRSRTA